MKFSKFLTTFSLSTILLATQIIDLPNRKVKQAYAQTRSPYVVFVNGYQDCCAWDMNIVRNSLPRDSEIIDVPWDSFIDGAKQRSNTSNDSLFLRQGKEILNKLDPNRPLILIGHSFGGDSIISLLPRINRRIQFVGVIDPTAAGGLRKPITRRTIPSNVDYFFNRWQKNGLGGNNIVPFDSRLVDGKVSRCNAKNCNEDAQNLARKSNGEAIRVSCGSLEVTCPGYQPWPGGSNGTKAKRLEHNNMPYDAYLQQQMANEIQKAIANVQPPTPSVNSSQMSNWPIFDADFYLMTYGDLRNAFGRDLNAAKNHWLTNGIKEARRSSPAFDVRYYRDIHSDLVKVFGNDFNGVIDHWLRHGIQEGRRSSLVFDVKYYLGKYPDLQNAFGSTNYSAAVDHWLRHGVSEGRQGSADFNSTCYLSNNPDVAKAYGANNYKGAIEHYLEFGKNEGRRGTC